MDETPHKKIIDEQIPRRKVVDAVTGLVSQPPTPPQEVLRYIPPVKLDPVGAANPSIASVNNAVRHRIRDGVPTQDTVPVPFNMVRLEDLSDQIPLVSPSQVIFQVRYQDVPTQRYMNAQVVPGTLVAYIDGSWIASTLAVDVNVNGNFTLHSAPQSSLLVTYAWQYLSDGEINHFIDESRQWLREFQSVAQIPDGLVPALVSYATSLALSALERTAILAPVRAGDSDIDWSKLSTAYCAAATQQYNLAMKEREQFYSQEPEFLDPNIVDVSHASFPSYTPLR